MRYTLLTASGAFILTVSAVSAAPPVSTAAPSAQSAEFFEKKVRPLLSEKCQSCHGAKRRQGGLRLDSRADMLKGGDDGPVVVPGEPDRSALVKAVRYADELKMPPKGKLSPESVETLAAWVRMGAPWPDARPGDGAAVRVSRVAEARTKHWSFLPVEKPPPPAVKDAGWARAPVDAFVLARLEAKGLAPAPPADRRTLLRRVTYDLTGLPPAPEEVEAFLADRSPDAYAKVVDRLLASPRYGERWARHWLDVARYADTKGYVFTDERRYPYAYTYRDYVIRAFNDDKPYDHFVTEQLAADLLPQGADRSSLAALGFLTLGRRFLNNQPDIIDDRIDVTMRGLMGLTVSCARCHDHKFDPIPTKDYYSLYGVFASCQEPTDLPAIAQPEQTAALAAFEKGLAEREAKLRNYLRDQHDALLKSFRARCGDYLLAAQALGDGPPEERGPQPLGPDDPKPPLVARWRGFLARTRERHDPVMAAWHAFAALPPANFAGRAPAVAAAVAAGGERTAPVNAAVARMFAGPPPGSLAEVARRYGELFKAVDREWQEAVRKAADAKSPPPAKLPDASREAVRQVLYGVGMPANVSEAEAPRFFDFAQRERRAALRKAVENWKATAPGAPPRAMVLRDLPTPVTPVVFVRGNPANHGPSVPRQFPEVLAGEGRKPFTQGSGRLELARAIVDPKNPLTARVLVNRVWQHHFGQGLVRTPGDFGLRGEPPTHPELLDWLAATFVEERWSVKKLHRHVLLSNTYRQSAECDDRVTAADPENRLLGRMNRQRLDFEALRDGLLAVGGGLDLTAGGPSVEITSAPFSARRSVYGFIDRQNLPGLFRTFDFASPDASTPQRYTTTVPQQALFLMNSPFVAEQAKRFAARPDVASQTRDEARIDRMHRLAYGRGAGPEDVEAGLRFLGVARAAGPAKLTPWEQYAQVLLLANEFAFVD